MKTYIVTRTGRRCTPTTVVLSDGTKIKVRATGKQVVGPISAADADKFKALPQTRVVAIKDVPAPAPAKPKKKGRKKK